jgi:arsenate reductase
MAERADGWSRPRRIGRGERMLPRSRDEILLLHNPRCSKSRATRALLEERGVDFETRRYLEDPLDEDELVDLERRLGRPILEWTRAGEPAFSEAGLSPGADEADVRAAMARAPSLMERPIVVRGGRAAIGRPPESVLALLDD